MSIRLPHSVFIHIPRTSGYWINTVLTELDLVEQRLIGDVDSHFTWDELPSTWQALRGFCYIRDPLEWAFSRWTHAIVYQVVDAYRHYGIHRDFDECVRPTFEETIRTIIDKKPGLVSSTFTIMGTGVEQVLITGDLEGTISLLVDFEGLPKNKVRDVVYSVPKENCSSDREEFKGMNLIPDPLKEEFLKSEVSLLQQPGSLSWQRSHQPE